MATLVKPKKAVKKVPRKAPAAPKPAASVKPPVKKVAARKPTAKPPVKKAPLKKTAPVKKAVAKKVPAKKTASKTTRDQTWRTMDEHGFMVGTDSAAIAAALVAGGTDRQAINDAVAKQIGTGTRNGTTKNIPALVSSIANRMIDRGYVVESSYRLVPPKK